MTAILLPPVPPSCRQRLTVHYGQSVEPWVDAAPELLATATEQWSLTPTGYHDAGHASVLVSAVDPYGRDLLVKAWPDRDRYAHEVRALRLWHHSAVDILQATDDRLAAAVMLTVGGTPGGAPRPVEETVLVAAAVQRAHEAGRGWDTGWQFPVLHDYLRDEVLPRVHRRRRDCGHQPLAEQAWLHVQDLAENADRTTVLHTDLYCENIPFTADGWPVLLDPLPMVGDAVFDWAFWSLYYRLGHGTGRRLRQASRTSGIPTAEITPWCLLLSLDGLLFYEATGDLRAPQMAAVLAALLEHAAPELTARRPR